MKILLFIYLWLSFLCANEVVCVVPQNIKKQFEPLFSKDISYSHMKVILKEIESENTIHGLNKFESAKFAIVRRDIAWQIQQSENNVTFITMSELPYRAQLYFIQKNTYLDLDMLSHKTISIGLLDDLDSYYLKELLDLYEIKYSVKYKSLSYNQSLDALKNSNIDGYFTFLPSIIPDDVHIQTLFREKTVEYFDGLGIFKIDYTGIYSPYILVSSLDATDEEIESMIYRLIEKEIFDPMTDRRYGRINEYVVVHLDSVKNALYQMQIRQQAQPVKINPVCRKYHYGFLKLLREKPKLKKYLKQKYSFVKQKKYIKRINVILLKLDNHKDRCDLNFFAEEKEKFQKLQEKIRNGI